MEGNYAVGQVLGNKNLLPLILANVDEGNPSEIAKLSAVCSRWRDIISSSVPLRQMVLFANRTVLPLVRVLNPKQGLPLKTIQALKHEATRLEKGARWPQREQDSANGQYIALHAAAQRGNPRTVEALLAVGWDPNDTTSAGWTALHAAVVGRDIQTVALVARAGVDLDRRDGAGKTAQDLLTDAVYRDLSNAEQLNHQKMINLAMRQQKIAELRAEELFEAAERGDFEGNVDEELNKIRADLETAPGEDFFAAEDQRKIQAKAFYQHRADSLHNAIEGEYWARIERKLTKTDPVPTSDLNTLVSTWARHKASSTQDSVQDLANDVGWRLRDALASIRDDWFG